MILRYPVRNFRCPFCGTKMRTEGGEDLHNFTAMWRLRNLAKIYRAWQVACRIETFHLNMTSFTILPNARLCKHLAQRRYDRAWVGNCHGHRRCSAFCCTRFCFSRAICSKGRAGRDATNAGVGTKSINLDKCGRFCIGVDSDR